MPWWAGVVVALVRIAADTAVQKVRSAMFFDPMDFVFMLPAISFVMFAQWKVTGTFKKCPNVQTNHRMTGAQVAQ